MSEETEEGGREEGIPCVCVCVCGQRSMRSFRLDEGATGCLG